MRNDVTYLAMILGLFVLMFLLVKACDRIIGPDEAALDEQGDEPAPPLTTDRDQEVAA